ncbi:MAG: HAMP domain-containing histidine kinase, partial [Bacteroidia bacterium]|nr:HAMP domain-containing histidine kinase [Bacteroidia bacterium]
NIKNSLTLKFTLIVASILFIFSVFTYQFSELFRRDEFTIRLKNVSTNVVKNYLDKVELTPEILRLMYQKQLNRFPEERLIIADENREVIFASNPLEDIEVDLLKKLYITRLSFEETDDATEYIAYIYDFNGTNYFIISSAIDKAGKEKLRFLLILLILLNLFFIIMAAVSGWYFSKQALQPIKKVISEVENITEISLDHRVSIGNGKDEIAQLAMVFNKMLDRIQNSFELQKLFVANASHEFRTPLTSMKGQIEVLLLKDRTESDYLKTFHSLQDDLQNLISLINGLTDLAKASVEFPNTKLVPVSILDVVMDTKDELLRRKSHYKIKLAWGEFPEEEQKIQTLGDYALLKSALNNLIDNACKFSSHHEASVDVRFYLDSIFIEIADNGPGISQKDLPHIFEPFYRSNETRTVSGYGIGLSLVKKTIDLHLGQIEFKSTLGKGTKVFVRLPNMQKNIAIESEEE